MTLTDEQRIKLNILRNKINTKIDRDYEQFGHCYKHFRMQNIYK